MERLAIGRIKSPHGVGGFLKVHSYSGEFEHFRKLEEVLLVSGTRERRFRVEESKLLGNSFLMKLSGIDSPEEGKRYSGWELRADRSSAAPLAPGEYYYGDLCECRLVNGGHDVARIVSVCEGGSSDLLEVETATGKRYFVPFIGEFVGEVDMANRTVELKADWLLQ